MTAKLNIITKEQQTLTVEWSDVDNLKHWMAKQRTRSAWLLDKPDSEFFAEYQTWIQTYWSLLEGLGSFELANTANILDIGSGIGVVDLFLAQRFTNSKLTLLDKNSFALIAGNQYGALHPFYNSWDPTLDALKTSNIDLHRFSFITPDDDWPKNCDFISSHFSWCWHYSVFTYLERVYESLNMNGKLLISIRFTTSEDVVDVLNNKFGTNLGLHYLKKTDQIHTEKNIFDVPGPYYGAIGLWQKTH